MDSNPPAETSLVVALKPWMYPRFSMTRNTVDERPGSQYRPMRVSPSGDTTTRSGSPTSGRRLETGAPNATLFQVIAAATTPTSAFIESMGPDSLRFPWPHPFRSGKRSFDYAPAVLYPSGHSARDDIAAVLRSLTPLLRI